MLDLVVRPLPLLTRVSAVFIVRDHMPVSCLNVPVETVVGKAGLTVREPSVQVWVGRVEDRGIRLEPVQLLGFLVEERSRILDGSLECS